MKAPEDVNSAPGLEISRLSHDCLQTCNPSGPLAIVESRPFIGPRSGASGLSALGLNEFPKFALHNNLLNVRCSKELREFHWRFAERHERRWFDLFRTPSATFHGLLVNRFHALYRSLLQANKKDPAGLPGLIEGVCPDIRLKSPHAPFGVLSQPVRHLAGSRRCQVEPEFNHGLYVVRSDEFASAVVRQASSGVGP